MAFALYTHSLLPEQYINLYTRTELMANLHEHVDRDSTRKSSIAHLGMDSHFGEKMKKN